MDECNAHALAYMPSTWLGEADSVLVEADTPAGVADLVCPSCGHPLFVYYRHGPKEKDGPSHN